MTEAPYQILPPLPDDDLAALRQSIMDYGVRVPIEVDEHGTIIDGHNRAAICCELGIDHPPRRVNTGLEDWEKRTLARELNVARRHLNAAQKRAMVEGQLRDTPSLSDRAIAGRLGVDHKTVGTRRKTLEGRGEIPHVEERTDTLGRSQPAERQKVRYVDESPSGRAQVVAEAERIRRENKDASAGLRAAVGNERNDNGADDANLYQTPWVATACLLKLVDLGPVVWEPACGPGAIGTELERAGHTVIASDKTDYSHDRDGVVNPFWEARAPRVMDFIADDVPAEFVDGVCDIVTNPPYNAADAFVSKALNLANTAGFRHVAMLLRLNFLAGCGAPRHLSLDLIPPARVLVFSRRLPMMHREDFDGDKASSRMDCAWFIWDLDIVRNDGVPPFQIERVDWQHCLGLSDEQARACRDGADRATVMPGGGAGPWAAQEKDGGSGDGRETTNGGAQK